MLVLRWSKIIFVPNHVVAPKVAAHAVMKTMVNRPINICCGPAPATLGELPRSAHNASGKILHSSNKL
jgi:hypothetical protein